MHVQVSRRRGKDTQTIRPKLDLQRIFTQSQAANITKMPGMNQTEVMGALEDLGLTPTLEELEMLIQVPTPTPEARLLLRSPKHETCYVGVE